MRTPPAKRVRFTQALRHAVMGLHYAVRTQRNFRIQLACAVIVAALAVWLRLSTAEAAVVALALFAVLIAELFNTGMEAIVDLLVARNHHDLARRAKDIAAAAVVLSIVGAVLAGGLILGPPLVVRLGLPAVWATRLAWTGAFAVVVAGIAGVLALLRRPASDAAQRSQT